MSYYRLDDTLALQLASSTDSPLVMSGVSTDTSKQRHDRPMCGAAGYGDQIDRPLGIPSPPSVTSKSAGVRESCHSAYKKENKKEKKARLGLICFKPTQ